MTDDTDDTDDRDDSVETIVHPSVVSVMREATPSQQEAVDRLVTAAESNGVKQTVTAKKLDWGPVKVKIEPNEDWHNEGELGLDRISVAVGKRQGINHGTRFTPTTDEDLGNQTFDEVERRVENMM